MLFDVKLIQTAVEHQELRLQNESHLYCRMIMFFKQGSSTNRESVVVSSLENQSKTLPSSAGLQHSAMTWRLKPRIRLKTDWNWGRGGPSNSTPGSPTSNPGALLYLLLALFDDHFPEVFNVVGVDLASTEPVRRADRSRNRETSREPTDTKRWKWMADLCGSSTGSHRADWQHTW